MVGRQEAAPALTPLDVSARPATADDLATLVRLYRLLEVEMEGLRGLWREADGLPEPIEEALAGAVADPDILVYIGSADDVPFGFILGESLPLLPQAEGERIATIKLVFTEEPAC